MTQDVTLVPRFALFHERVVVVDVLVKPDLQVGVYVRDFHPRMLGLTGTPGQIAALAKRFRVFFQEVDRDDESDDYLVDHSIVAYLMSPEGEFLDFYTQLLTAGEVAERMAATIAKQEKAKLALSK